MANVPRVSERAVLDDYEEGGATYWALRELAACVAEKTVLSIAASLATR